MPRYDADWINKMLQPDLRGAPPAQRTIAQLGLQPGDVVADIGCGPGFFTLPSARAVSPGGRVYAVDLEPKMLAVIRDRAQREEIVGIETRQSRGLPIPLDDQIADWTICALLLHDVDDREALIRELHRVTKPGGRIVVVEWLPEPNETRPNRMAPQITEGLLAITGRQIHQFEPLGTQQYLVVAEI